MFLLAPATSATWPSSRSASGPMPRSPMHDRPCGHVEVLPGDRSGVVRAEVANGGDDVVRRGEAAQRRRGLERLAGVRALRLQHAVEALALDGPRRDEVHADAVRTGLPGERP